MDRWITVGGYGVLAVNFPEKQKLPKGYDVFYRDEGSYGISINGNEMDGMYCNRFHARRVLLKAYKEKS